MNKGIFVRVLLCILICGAFLYSYISKQNKIAELRIAIPSLNQELKELHEDNTRLKFEIDQFEDPTHLIELSKQPQFRHLKHPLLKDIIEIKIKAAPPSP